MEHYKKGYRIQVEKRVWDYIKKRSNKKFYPMNSVIIDLIKFRLAHQKKKQEDKNVNA